MSVKILDDKETFDKALKDATTKLVVVDFYADWCGPCKTIAPKIAKMAEEFLDVVFVKVNVDDNEEVALEYGVTAMPTFKFIKEGKQIAEVIGADANKLRAEVVKHK